MPYKNGVTQEELTGILTVINNLSSSNEKATIDAISSHMPTEPSADRLLKIISEAVSIGSIVKSSDGESFQPAHSLRPQRRPSLVHGGIVDTTKSRRCGVTENLKSPALSPTATPNPLLNGSPTTPKARNMAEIIPICSFCLGDEEKNSKGEPEEMIACWGCGRSGHPNCLQMTPAILERVRRLRWYCVDCKCCTLCHYSINSNTDGIRHGTAATIHGDSPNENYTAVATAVDKDSDLLLCDSCDRGFHLSCVAPDLSEPPEGIWNCPICQHLERNDPRLSAAAVCDVLTNYEIQLIRKALRGGAGGRTAAKGHSRPPSSSAGTNKPLSSPHPVSSKHPHHQKALLPKSETKKNKAGGAVFVQQMITGWAVKMELKNGNDQKSPAAPSSANQITTRRGGVLKSPTPGCNRHLSPPSRPSSTLGAESPRTTRSSSTAVLLFRDPLSPPPSHQQLLQQQRKRRRLSPSLAPLHVDIPAGDEEDEDASSKSVLDKSSDAWTTDVSFAPFTPGRKRTAPRIPKTAPPLSRGRRQRGRPRLHGTHSKATSAAQRLVRTGIKRLRTRNKRPAGVVHSLRLDDSIDDSSPIPVETSTATETTSFEDDAVDGATRSVGRRRTALGVAGSACPSGPRRSTTDDVDEEAEEDCRFREVQEEDRSLFADIQAQVQKSLPQTLESSKQLPPTNNPRLLFEISHCEDNSNQSNNSQLSSAAAISLKPEPRYPPKIQLGKHCITTWYSAPYPSEYARLNLLYICESCLKYVKTRNVHLRHINKCASYYPPGNEIYRCASISVFEVDGYSSKLYCQQLCLLAKLFLDHKTLYYDVEPFLFYVATVHDATGYHIVGYFSKEKRSTQKYNLSCIMVLPPYQKQAFGRFLIDFSYLLSRIEGVPGSPEKPLSDLGRLSYESYWRSKVLPYIVADGEIGDVGAIMPEVTIREISEATGIEVHDVVATLQQLASGVQLHPTDGRPMLSFDTEVLLPLKEKYDARARNWIQIDEECLRWSPLTNHLDQETSLESPNALSRVTSPSRVRKDSFNAPMSVVDQVKSPPPQPDRPCDNSTTATTPIQPPQTPSARPPPPPSSTARTTTGRGRGRPRRTPLPFQSQTLPTSSTRSILLDAFPLPALDVVDSASAVGYATKLDSASVEVAEEKKPAVMVKGGGRTPCRRASGVFGEHKRPPDSPPSDSGGGVTGTRSLRSSHASTSSSSTTSSGSTVNGVAPSSSSTSTSSTTPANNHRASPAAGSNQGDADEAKEQGSRRPSDMYNLRGRRPRRSRGRPSLNSPRVAVPPTSLTESSRPTTFLRPIPLELNVHRPPEQISTPSGSPIELVRGGENAIPLYMSPIIGIALAHDTPADILFNEEEVDGDPGVHKRINFAEYEAEVQKQEAEENATLTGQSPSFIPPDLGGPHGTPHHHHHHLPPETHPTAAVPSGIGVLVSSPTDFSPSSFSTTGGGGGSGGVVAGCEGDGLVATYVTAQIRQLRQCRSSVDLRYASSADSVMAIDEEVAVFPSTLHKPESLPQLSLHDDDDGDTVLSHISSRETLPMTINASMSEESLESARTIPMRGGGISGAESSITSESLLRALDLAGRISPDPSSRSPRPFSFNLKILRHASEEQRGPQLEECEECLCPSDKSKKPHVTLVEAVDLHEVPASSFAVSASSEEVACPSSSPKRSLSPVFPERPVSPLNPPRVIQPATVSGIYPPPVAPCLCPACVAPAGPGLTWMPAPPAPPCSCCTTFIDPSTGVPVFATCCVPAFSAGPAFISFCPPPGAASVSPHNNPPFAAFPQAFVGAAPVQPPQPHPIMQPPLPPPQVIPHPMPQMHPLQQQQQQPDWTFETTANPSLV